MAIVIRKIDVSEIDLTDYEAFAAKCRGQINVGAQNSLNLSIEAANIGAKLSEYKALLSFTASEIEYEVKKIYSEAFMSAQKNDPSATSDLKREAVARQNPAYLDKIAERAKINAMLEYINGCIDHVTKLHYIFKATYLTDVKLPITGFQQF